MSPHMRRTAAAVALGLALALGAMTGWAQQSDVGTAQEAQSAPAAELSADAGVEATLAGAGEVTDGAATDAGAVDYAAWDKVATRAEQALEAGRASDQALQTLRAELVKWREVFTKARAENEVRIKTLETQINTLGPEPADGENEPAAIAQTRALLNTQLEEAQAPVKAAELALARGNALIAQIDTTLRTRQTDALFVLGPTPINPAIWPKAADDLFTTVRLAWSGVKSTFGSDAQRAEFLQNLPIALVFGVAALVLILRGRAWVVHAGVRWRAASSGATRNAWWFVLSLGQFAAPLAGVYALVEALHHAGVLGLRAQVMADALPMLGLAFFFARWLAGVVFAADDAHNMTPLRLEPRAKGEARFHVATLGFLYGLSRLLGDIAAYETYSDNTRVVLGFPIVLIAGISLFRLGQVLRANARAMSRDNETGAGFLIRTLGSVALALMLAGAAGPLAAAVGYTKLADSFVFPTVLTAALVATLLGLHGFFVSLHGALFKTSIERAQEALLPVLASFVVALLMLPVLALIWGARVSDLTELWARLGEGVQIGDTVIAPANMLTLAIVFAIGYGATRLVQGTLKSTVLPKTRLDIGGQNAITAGVGYVGVFLATIVAVTSAGINLSSLAIVAGALSVGIGFGLQNIVSNFVSGIILLIERPISEGDWIEVGGQMGFVRDISVRSTRIETFDRTDVILPNSDLISGVVTNYTRGNSVGRVIVPVGVAYGSDTKRVEVILREIAEAHPLVTVNPAPSVFFREFGADSLNFEIRAILRDVNFKLSVHSQMNHEIARRFAEEGIEVPFAQRDIWLRNPEALAKGLAGQGHATPAQEGGVPSEGVPSPCDTTDDSSETGPADAGDGGDGR